MAFIWMAIARESAFHDPDTQIKACDLIQKELGDNYIIALNLLSSSPAWFAKLKAHPMFLGLDLRGGALPAGSGHESRGG